MTCPKCGYGSRGSFEKEYIRGMQTGDVICPKCGYTGWPGDFEKPSVSSDTQPTADAPTGQETA